MLLSTTFRFQGALDFDRLYRESKEFLMRRIKITSFIEKKFKQKDDEVEFAWVVKQNYDLYCQLVYEVEVKFTDFREVVTVQNGKEVKLLDGKLRVYVNASYETNYAVESVLGKTKLFDDDSFIHKVYKTVTSRDRSDGVEDLASLTAVQFLAVMKEVCGTEARVSG